MISSRYPKEKLNETFLACLHLFDTIQFPWFPQETWRHRRGSPVIDVLWINVFCSPPQIHFEAPLITLFRWSWLRIISFLMISETLHDSTYSGRKQGEGSYLEDTCQVISLCSLLWPQTCVPPNCRNTFLLPLNSLGMEI